MQRMRIPAKKILIHGFLILATLIIIQLAIDASQNSLLLYMPPIGFAFFLLISYGFQPFIVGVLNVVTLNRLYNCEGWRIGFWLNGLLLMLAFSTINLLLQTVAHVPFSVYVAIPELLLLPYPFGYLGKFSNRGIQNTIEAEKAPPKP